MVPPKSARQALGSASAQSSEIGHEETRSQLNTGRTIWPCGKACFQRTSSDQKRMSPLTMFSKPLMMSSGIPVFISQRSKLRQRAWMKLRPPIWNLDRIGSQVAAIRWVIDLCGRTGSRLIPRRQKVSNLLQHKPKIAIWGLAKGSICVHEGEPIFQNAIRRKTGWRFVFWRMNRPFPANFQIFRTHFQNELCADPLPRQLRKDWQSNQKSGVWPLRADLISKSPTFGKNYRHVAIRSVGTEARNDSKSTLALIITRYSSSSEQGHQL